MCIINIFRCLFNIFEIIIFFSLLSCSFIIIIDKNLGTIISDICVLVERQNFKNNKKAKYKTKISLLFFLFYLINNFSKLKIIYFMENS